tara:strand:+ start:27490 stop:27789 length:300 start_codon:yes stop_codon:yes gene_type:complete
MFENEPSTLSQIPSNAQQYYEESLRSDIYRYIYLGQDECRRSVFTRTWWDGVPVGQPTALLSYRDFVKAVRKAHNAGMRNTGIPRFTYPYGKVKKPSYL